MRSRDLRLSSKRLAIARALMLLGFVALAARAGVFESGEGWEARISDDPGLAALAWLGYLQSDLLSALTDSQGANW